MGIGSKPLLRSCSRKRASRAKAWVPAFRLRRGCGGLGPKPVEASWRRRVAGTSGVAALALALLALLTPAAAQFGPPELIEAARQEGKLVFYSANVAESEKPILDAFNKRFPFVKIEFLRAPGNQLLQRVKTEAAAGKLLADVIDHSDRALMREIENIFRDYAPPNAADYLPEALASPKLWPRSTVVWSIAYNSELMKNPPKSWMDLTKPEYGNKQIGQVIAPSGGTTWTRAMFERQAVDPDYWRKQAATTPVLFPSNAPTSDALVRGEIVIAPLLYNAIFPKLRDGAPVKVFFAPEGAPMTPFAAGIPKTAAHPNAAKLFLNWCLSEEGQATMIREIGNLTSLKKAPLYPEGFDPNVVKVWVPKYDEFVKLQREWLEEWNRIYGYRQ